MPAIQRGPGGRPTPSQPVPSPDR